MSKHFYAAEERRKGKKENMDWAKPRFRCAHPGCGASYARKEHLVRHAEQHDQDRKFVCPECGMKFSRKDSLRRHAKLHSDTNSRNPRKVPFTRVERACDLCRSLKSKCDRDNPCARCARRGLQCTFDKFTNESVAVTRSSSVMSGSGNETLSRHKRKRAETPDPSDFQDFAAPATVGDEEEHNLRMTLRQHETQIQYDLMNVPDQQHLEQQQRQRQNSSAPSLRLSTLFKKSQDFIVDVNSQDVDNADGDEDMDAYMSSIDVQHYVDLFFLYVHPKWPFLFRSAFRTESEPPILVLAVVMFGLWITEEARLMKLAWIIHARLRIIFETQMGNWVVETASARTGRWPVVTYQSILLFTIFAMTAHGPTEVFDEDDNNSSSGDILDHAYAMFTILARTCRAQGVLYYPAMLAQTSIDDPIIFKFSSLEELKYFALTLYKVDHLLSQLMLPEITNSAQAQTQTEAHKERNDNTTTNNKLLISDLQFPLPDSGYMFETSSTREFLFRRERQSRDPSTLSARHAAIVADDRRTMLDREKNPWICDILLAVYSASSSSSSSSLTTVDQQRKRRKAWMSLGPWLGFLGGLDPVFVSSGSM